MNNERTRASREAIRATLFIFALFLLLAAIAGIGGYRVFREQRDEIIEQKHQELFAVADLKVREIAFWRRERIADASVIAGTPLLDDELTGWLAERSDAAARRKLLAWMGSLRQVLSYRAVAIIDAEGKVLLGSGLDPNDSVALSVEPWPPVDTVLTDIHEPVAGGMATIGIYSPIAAPAGLARHLVLYLEIDPSLYLFPLLKSWPTSSASGETLIVRREGNEIVYLNELRHRSGGALKLRLPLGTTDLPASRAARGESGVLDGTDYRGAPVFAVGRPIPGTSWFLIAKDDRTEVLGRIQYRARSITTFGALTLLLATAIMLYLWRRERLRQVHGELVHAEAHAAEMERAAELLRGSEKRYRLLFDEMLDGYAHHEMVYDSAGTAVDYRFLELNPAFGRLTGLAPEQAVGRTVREVLPGVEQSWIDAYAEVVRTGEPRHFENFSAPLARWYEISAFRTEPGRFGTVFKDVTERQQAAEAIQRTLVELRRSNEELLQFAYIASHDLQEPLRMIASFLQLIERRYADRLDAEGREFIAFAVGGAERLQRMIDGLLAYSRMERAPAATALVEAGPALERALSNLQLQIAEAGAVVTSDLLPAVLVDAGLLVQLFQNLIGNAIKFRGTAPSRVHVSSAAGPEGWRTFTVSDNGIGFDSKYAERVFGVFRRLHGQKYPGSGIGLALCRRIVERSGGKIWVETAPGKGARFYFTLPDQGGAK